MLNKLSKILFKKYIGARAIIHPPAMGKEWNYMLINDRRAFTNRQDTFGACRKCGCNLILLPEDKRRGFCFDCYDPLETDETTIFTRTQVRVACGSE